MWLSLCCLFIALIFGIVSVGMDVLFTAHGQSYRLGNEISADVQYSHKEIGMRVLYEYDEEVFANRTTVVSYSEVYNDLCVESNLRNQNVDSSYCDDIQNLQHDGQTYFGFAVFAVVLMAVTVMTAFLITVVRCCCKKPMLLGAYFVAGSTIVSILSSIVAMFISWNSLAKNARETNAQTYAYYYPVAELDTEWDDGRLGPSLICSYLSVGFGLIAVLSVLLLEKRGCVGCRNANSRANPRGGESPPLLEGEGQMPSEGNSTSQNGETGFYRV